MTRPNGDIDAIRQLAGEAEALLSLYPNTPVLMPQNQPAVVDKEAILSPYQSIFE